MAALIAGSIWFFTFVAGLIVLIVTWFRCRGVLRDGVPARELISIFPFAEWTIGANIVHLVAVQARILAPLTEILFFSSWWLGIYLWNMRDFQWRSTRIILSFLLQLAIMYLLRTHLY